MSSPVEAQTLEALRDRLRAYDGKATTILGEAEAALRFEPGYLDALIALGRARGGHMAAGATWLIKSACETKVEVSSEQMHAFVELLGSATDWAAKLHLCQSMRHLTFTSEQADRTAEWLMPLLDHDRPFIRAWALDALVYLAASHSAHARAAAAALDAAADDQAASVRARARQLVAAKAKE